MRFEDCRHPLDDCDRGGDFILLFYFTRNKKIMVTLSFVPKDARDIGPYYTFDEQILFFYTRI